MREKGIPRKDRDIKSQLRQRKIAARDSLTPDELREKSYAIAARILESSFFRSAKTVMLYRAVRGEVCLDMLPELASDKRFVYPVCLDRERMGAFEPGVRETEHFLRSRIGESEFESCARETEHALRAEMRRRALTGQYTENNKGDVPGVWKKGAFGILEPDPAYSREVPPEEIGLVICPCTAFDRNHNRLGMGGGYYDRFLVRCVNAAVIAAAFAVQEADEVPAGEYDIRMDAVITEAGII